MVESRNYMGTPPHRLAPSRSLEYDPSASSIYVVEYDDFALLDPRVIQNIFRHRHILVRNSPQKILEFDREGLSTLGPTNKLFYFQGELKSQLFAKFSI
jgi:hypothetical protein